MSIYCKELNKSFESKNEMFIALKNDFNKILEAKKSTIKYADSIGSYLVENNTAEVLNTLKTLSLKAVSPTASVDYTKELNLPKIVVKAVSNCTNYFDNHNDVHIDGNYNQTVSLNGQKAFPHIQEHKQNSFAHVISDDVTTSIENTTFKALGYNLEGNTQALKFESKIDPNRNLFMYNQYANKWVKQHSIGMMYVGSKLFFCINTDMKGYEEEKANWDKYYPVIANKSDVDEYGYFWAVTEIKLIEHSAVPFGSNKITPTQAVDIDVEDIEKADNSVVEIQPDNSLIQQKRKRVLI